MPFNECRNSSESTVSRVVNEKYAQQLVSRRSCGRRENSCNVRWECWLCRMDDMIWSTRSDRKPSKHFMSNFETFSVSFIIFALCGPHLRQIVFTRLGFGFGEECFYRKDFKDGFPGCWVACASGARTFVGIWIFNVVKNISFPQTNAAHRQYTIIIHPFFEMFIFSMAMAKCLPLQAEHTAGTRWWWRRRWWRRRRGRRRIKSRKILSLKFEKLVL